MKLEYEITGEAKGVDIYEVFSVELFLNDSSVGFLNMNLETERVDNSLDWESSMIFDFFDIAENFRGYKAFLGLLGIEVPKLSLAHWTPAKNSKAYVIVDSEIEQASSDRAEVKKACLNYNVFPSLELAERAINLSKLDRLILLWQYKNNCLFIKPNWKNVDQPKHSVIYVEMYKELRADTIYTVREHKTYFEKREQVKTFIEMYDKEIKKIMGGI